MKIKKCKSITVLIYICVFVKLFDTPPPSPSLTNDFIFSFFNVAAIESELLKEFVYFLFSLCSGLI